MNNLSLVDRSTPKPQIANGEENVLPFSYPAGTALAPENTGYSDGHDENTTESTTWANFYAKCIKQHLEAEEIQELMEQPAVAPS